MRFKNTNNTKAKEQNDRAMAAIFIIAKSSKTNLVL